MVAVNHSCYLKSAVLLKLFHCLVDDKNELITLKDLRCSPKWQVWNYFQVSSVCYVLLSQLRLLATLWMSNVYSALSSAAPLSSCRLMPMASFMEPFHHYNFQFTSVHAFVPCSDCVLYSIILSFCLCAHQPLDILMAWV